MALNLSFPVPSSHVFPKTIRNNIAFNEVRTWYGGSGKKIAESAYCNALESGNWQDTHFDLTFKTENTSFTVYRLRQEEIFTRRKNASFALINMIRWLSSDHSEVQWVLIERFVYVAKASSSVIFETDDEAFMLMFKMKFG